MFSFCSSFYTLVVKQAFSTKQSARLFENCKIDVVQKSLNQRFGNAAFFRVQD